jgi:hypothetical protein
MLFPMMKGILISMAGILAACGSVKGTGGTPGIDASSPDSAANPDAAAPRCDLTKPFAPAVEVPGLHDPLATDVHATFTDDELTVYFGTNRMDHGTNMHIYSATRTAPDGGFSTPMLVNALYSDQGDSHPAVSPDGNTIYFDSARAPQGGGHIYTSTRSNAGVVFPTPTMIAGDFVASPGITADGQALYVSDLSHGLITRMARSGDTFGAQETVALAVQNSVVSPVTRDELTLYFSLGDTIGNDIYVAKRSSTSAPWPTPTEVSELKTGAFVAEPSWLSADGCRLYLNYAGSDGKSIIYVATRPK